jgi:predicted esterase
MSRPLSQLIHHRVQSENDSPRIITLHKYNQFAQDVAEYGVAGAPNGRVIGLESYKGVYRWKTITGYQWFVGPSTRPSPLFFGDSLAEIERFLWDEIDRQETTEPELPFLVGVEQGAIMALAAAAAVPDLLSGVIAIDGFLPVVPGWDPPLVPLDGLPILLIDPPEPIETVENVLAGEDLVERLRSWGAIVEHRREDVGRVPSETMAGWMSGRTARRHRESVTES